MDQEGIAMGRIWLGLAMLAGIAYDLLATGPAPWLAGGLAGTIALKMAGVALLAAYAAQGRRVIALVLALGALGDGLIEVSLIAGALAFLAGHLIAIAFYWRERRDGPPGRLIAAPIAGLVVLSDAAFALSGRIETGIYGLALGAMVGMAWNSRFPRALVGFGAVLFAASDLLLFARMGIMAHSAVPGHLVWPLYFAGQALIAIGVVESPDQGSTTAPDASRSSGPWASAADKGRGA